MFRKWVPVLSDEVVGPTPSLNWPTALSAFAMNRTVYCSPFFGDVKHVVGHRDSIICGRPQICRLRASGVREMVLVDDGKTDNSTLATSYRFP